MSIPTLQPVLFWGLRTGIRKGAQYISDFEVVYPAGGVIVMHNYMQRRQRYLPLVDKTKEISCIAITPNRKFLAIAEKGEKPVISMYEFSTLKRKKVLQPPPEAQSEEFQDMNFTHDSRLLMAIVGEPDWIMVCYAWEKGKIDSTVKAANPQNPGPVLQVVPNPTDATIVCLIGPGLFRLMGLADNLWRPYGFSKSEAYPISCVCWLGIDRVLAGTRDGRLLLIEFGELKAVLRASELQVIDFKSKEFEQRPSSAEEDVLNIIQTEILDENLAIQDLISFSKGFTFIIGGGTVFLFEKESNHKYVKRNVFKLEYCPEEEAAGLDFELGGESSTDLRENYIIGLSVSTSASNLLAVTRRSQLYNVQLWGPDLNETPEVYFTPLGERLHQGNIIALALCPWKQIFMTCGQIDHTVRVWNYDSQHLDLTKWYQEDIFSACLHPTGLFAVIGFSDKLRFMELLIDDIKTIKEFSIRACKVCSFSKNGHLFAAVDFSVIQIFSTVTHEIMMSLRGHNGRVTDISWNVKDSKLYSCGLEGAIYEWDTYLGKRVGEVIEKQCQFYSLNTTSDGKNAYAVSSDGAVIQISDSQVVKRNSILDEALTHVVLARSDQMLFVTGGNGTVISVKFPLSHEPDFIEFHMHNKSVTAMALSADDLTLITCSEDGSICLWKLTNTEGKTAKVDKDFVYSNDILIAKDELEDKINAIKDLKSRMQELVMEHTYQMQQQETTHSEKTSEIHEAYGQAIKELKEKNEQMEVEHTEEINNINSDIAKMKENHENAIQTLESNFNAKLIVEYDKYSALDERLYELRRNFLKQLEDLAESKKQAIQDLTQHYEEQLHDKNVTIEELHQEAAVKFKENEEIKKQIEDDADREIIELKTQYEEQLKDEKETIVQLRGETGVMKKKFIGSQKEVEEFKHQIYTLQQEHQRFVKVISNLERDISDLKKEIQERDGTIQEKESRIYELKRKNQELEKYKFVLNYKIKELKNQIEPKEREIREQKQQMAEMEEELEGLQKINTSLELQTQELSEKLRATHNELKKEQGENKRNNYTLSRMRIDIHNASGLIQEPRKLKDAIRELYHKYSMDASYVMTRKADEDVQEEFMRQREFLEHTIKVLKRQINVQKTGKSADSGKIMEENAILISEVNQLRRELKQARTEIKDMQSIMGVSGRYMDCKQAQDRLQAAVKTREEIKKEFEEKIKKLEVMNAQLREDVDRLMKLKSDTRNDPGSAEKEDIESP